MEEQDNYDIEKQKKMKEITNISILICSMKSKRTVNDSN